MIVNRAPQCLRPLRGQNGLDLVLSNGPDHRLNRAARPMCYQAYGTSTDMSSSISRPRSARLCSARGHHRVIANVQRAVEMGGVCALESEEHILAAQKLCDLVPAFDMVRCSGVSGRSVGG